MKLLNLQRVGNYEVCKYFKESIPNLTEYQKEKLYDVIISAEFDYMQPRKKEKTNIWLRLSIIFLLPTVLLIIISLPFNYFITGSWGYKFKALDWYTDWASKCGF